MEAKEEILKNESFNSEIYQILYEMILEGIEDGSIKKSIDAEKLAKAFWNDENSFIAEFRYIGKNSYDYLYNLIIESIKN